MTKGHITSLCAELEKGSHLTSIVRGEERQNFTDAMAASKQAESHNFKMYI